MHVVNRSMLPVSALVSTQYSYSSVACLASGETQVSLVSLNPHGRRSNEIDATLKEAHNKLSQDKAVKEEVEYPPKV